MKKLLLSGVLALVISAALHAQKVIFLHHSTGGAVCSEGNVSGWISNYNTAHSTNYQLIERAYPNSPYPWENYPYDFWNLWANPSSACNSGQTGIECMNTLTQNYNVIIFKHCFPGADILADENTSSVSSSTKTLGNYKLQYRALRSMMDSYPNNKFIVWTLAPLHRLSTNTANAARARQFVDWVKNQWLTEDGKSHPNIYIFDFWGIVAETNAAPAQGLVNCLKYDYEGSHTGNDSHPNTLANQTAGPLFAQFIVSTIESNTSNTPDTNQEVTVRITPLSGKGLTIDQQNPKADQSVINIYDLNGRIVFNTQLTRAKQNLYLPQLSPGIYFYFIQQKNNTFRGKTFIID